MARTERITFRLGSVGRDKIKALADEEGADMSKAMRAIMVAGLSYRGVIEEARRILRAEKLAAEREVKI